MPTSPARPAGPGSPSSTGSSGTSTSSTTCTRATGRGCRSSSRPPTRARRWKKDQAKSASSSTPAARRRTGATARSRRRAPTRSSTPAAGSHATFYEAAVYVENGRKGSGVGCDDTSAPLRRLDVTPIQVPTNPGPNSPYVWLDYEGRWGQFEKSFNNGPTGPSTKARWLEPMTWMEEIRSTSPRLPAGSVLGPTVTKAFCGAVAEVTSFMNHTQDSQWIAIGLLVVALLLIGAIVWRTRWRPLDLGNLRRSRAFGQLLFASAGLYWRHWRTFGLIGLTAIPIVGGFNALTWLLTGDPGRRLDDEVGLSGLHVALGEVLSGIGGPIASALVAAVVIVAVRQIDESGRASFTGAYRGMWQRFRRVVGAQLLATLGVFLMLISIRNIPFAAWKYVGWLFIQQQILFEGKPLREAFRGSPT